jgi:hypothetical protein
MTRTNNPCRVRRSTWALCLLATALGSAPALASEKDVTRAVQARYQRDSALCLSARYKGDRDECLSAASTTRSMALPAQLDADPGRYARNLLKRCEPLPPSDRRDCVARMQGEGTTSGSVAGGGIYRELVTRETEAPKPAAVE